jgi:hypothetical protein
MKLLAILLLLTIILDSHINAFGIPSPFDTRNTISRHTSISARYGPPDEDSPDTNHAVTVEPSAEQKAKFASIFNQVMECQVREHLPSILTSNIDFLLQLRGEAGVNLIQEQVAKVEATEDEEMIQRAHAAVEYMVYFLEAFVSEAKILDDNNKQLLGKILRCMTDEGDGQSSFTKEEKLDVLMNEEKQNFTPGFLRHLEGECTRIGNAKKMDKETTKLLEVMRMIQTRVIEELGQDLGEGAQVLSQLLGYESDEERLAVLDAGLKVRGKGFATELKAMTEEALEGFQNVPGGVDPGLVSIIEEVDRRIGKFIESK